MKDFENRESWISELQGEWCRVGVNWGVCEGECAGNRSVGRSWKR